MESKNVMRKGDPLAQRTGYIPQGVRAVPVDSEAYLNEREDRIPVDELFLYKYLKSKQGTTAKIEDEDDEDNESVTSEDFNAMLDGLAKDKDFEDVDIAANINTSKSKKKSKKIN